MKIIDALLPIFVLQEAGRLLNIISRPLDAGSQANFEKSLQIMTIGNNKATRDLAIKIMKKIRITPVIVPKKHVSKVTASNVYLITLIKHNTYFMVYD